MSRRLFGQRGIALLLTVIASVAQAQGGPLVGGVGGPGGPAASVQLYVVVHPAQAPEPDPRGLTAQNARLLAGITLSEAQQTQVEAVQRHHRLVLQGMMVPGDDPATRRDRIAVMRHAHRTALRDLLTGEQLPLFDQNLADMSRDPGRDP
ncbi:MAG: hypothetical protein ACO32Z_04785 [Gemmatimonadaceae bacterium]|jgi:hypothetical protein